MKILLILLFAFGLSFGSQAQHTSAEEDNIRANIKELFDAYRAGDSARVAATFTKGATLQSVGKNKEGEIEISEPVPVQKFLNYIGNGFSEIHDERLWDTRVFYDDFMATVWTKYAFYLGENLHHCGTEVLHLRKVKGAWKIFQLIDTRQEEGCRVPNDIK